MDVLTDPEPAVAPQATAGLLLAARTRLEQLGLPHPSVSQILGATDATRSRAYEIRDQIAGLLPSLVRPPGRPRADPEPPKSSASQTQAALSRELLCFLMDHPGCVSGGPRRRRYSDGFRRRVLELCEKHSELDLETFAQASGVPKGTLEDWLRAGLAEPGEAGPSEDPSPPQNSAQDGARLARIETVLTAWREWRGSFTRFCEHVRSHHRLDFANTLISSILFEHGERQPRSRAGRSRDEEATRQSFETFFPGAQWVGDGTGMEITIDQQRFGYNLELIVDAASDAFVGTSVRDEEDSLALTQAFEQGLETTGASPLALLLDNKPSNHTPEVQETLGETLKIRATQGRAQNKAHVEGGFGLFSQQVPPLAVTTHDRRELGRELARFTADLFVRIINHRPRRDRAGKSRAQIYQEAKPTPEERENAREALRQRLRKQERARQTRRARLDPIRREVLDLAFERLGLIDPERHFRDTIACYPLDDIVDGIATFEGKRKRDTLPEGVDARYLLGIVRNIHHLHDSEAITEELLRQRLGARDKLLEPLVLQRDAILAQHETSSALSTLIDQALEAERSLDRFFWLTTAADLIVAQPETDRPGLYRSAARRIHATFALGTRQRFEAERFLLRRIWPLA